MTETADLPGLTLIRSRFVARLDQKIALLEDFLEALESGPREPSDDAIFQAHRALHSIAGSAGTLGFVVLGKMAQRAEQEIIGYRERGKIAGPQLGRSIEDFLDEVIKMSAGLDTSSAGGA